MGILKSEKFSPFIFIGLGGSGNKVVDKIAQKLQMHPFWDRIRSLVHFVAIDTNKHDLGRVQNIPERNHFLISSFDRTTYIDRKRGNRELAEDKLVTQWVPPNYTFREGATPGAGQIRIESRLSLYYNLEDDRAGMVAKLERILDEMTKPDTPYREDRDRVVNVMMYGSGAGGTGSGSFASMAYLVRRVIQDHGWGRAKVVGNFMLPSLFYGFVEQVLQQDINANAYAALKEIEHLTRLGYPGRQQREQFHYDPIARRPTFVDSRPFALLYLIDKPAELGVQKHYDALADASFLQVFSPLLGSQEGEYDNYEKHQKTLAQGHFTVHYGSYGSSVLHFPRKDLLSYARRRYVARAFDKFLNFGDDPRFAVDWEDKRFTLQSEAEQNKQVDEKFALWVAYKAELESEEELKGVFTAIHDQENERGDKLRELFRQRLFEVFDDVDSRVEIEPLDVVQIRETSTSLQRPLNQMRKEVNESRAKVLEKENSVSMDVQSGRFFGDFFRKEDVNPLAQRYFLIALAGEEYRREDGRMERRIGPFEDVEDSAVIFEETENRYNLDSPQVSESVKDMEKRLGAAAKRGMLSFGENKKFNDARKAAQDEFDELQKGNREWLKTMFWQRLHKTLQDEIDRRLGAFRAVARLSSEQVNNLQTESAGFIKDPGSVDPNAQSAAYYLDLEIMRDDRAGERQWEQFFRHRFDKRENFDDKEMFTIITKAFAPAQEDGHVRAKQAREIVQDIRAGLEVEADKTFERSLADMTDMNLAGALQLEARYALAGPDAIKDEQLAAVPEAEVEEYMRDKIRRAVDSCVVLANIDRTKFDDPTVRANQSAFAGIHPRYCGEDRLSIGSLVTQTDGKMEIVDDWTEEDAIVFYRAVLGVPLYFFSRVSGEYYRDYMRVKANPVRTYPLHIDRNFETLPNLDPMEIQAAEDKRRREEEAAQQLASRNETLWGFTLAGLIGSVVKEEEGYVLSRGGREKQLAARRCEAYTAFGELPEAFRGDVVTEGLAVVERAMASRKERGKVHQRLVEWEAKLAGLYNDAMFDEDEREQQFLEEERDVVKSHIEALS